MPDWAQTAFIFPGQGSQEVGMGVDLAQTYPAAMDIFRAADDLLGFALSELCWHGPAESLSDTYNTQPALYVAGIATLQALEAEMVDVAPPAYMAGHSLGEITALAAAGAISFEDGLRLVRERGRLMKQAGEETPGAMAAVLGLATDTVQAICEQASQEIGLALVIANNNCPGQIVISGNAAALERGLELASEAGAKHAVRLAVSIASHSPLMLPIQEAFRAALDNVAFQTPKVPVIGNVGAAPLIDAAAIREELGAQLTSSVRWTESIGALQAAGITRFVEIGPKDVLSGLVKRIDRNAERVSLNSVDAVRQFAQT